MAHQRRIGLPFTLAALVVRPVLRLLAARRWRGAERLPDGGIVLVSNHVSWADPLTLTDFLLVAGREPRFLAKQALFRVPVVGLVLRRTLQVPVLRGGADAATALRAAEVAVRAGECVVVYTDGTLTKDPQLWPMVGKTGAARLALSTGCPVVPVVQWGPHELLPQHGRPRLWPRSRVQVEAGEPVDLSRWADQPLSAEVLRGATDDVVGALVAMLEELRGESDPGRWDPRTHSRRPVL